MGSNEKEVSHFTKVFFVTCCLAWCSKLFEDFFFKYITLRFNSTAYRRLQFCFPGRPPWWFRLFLVNPIRVSKQIFKRPTQNVTIIRE